MLKLHTAIKKICNLFKRIVTSCDKKWSGRIHIALLHIHEDIDTYDSDYIITYSDIDTYDSDYIITYSDIDTYDSDYIITYSDIDTYD